METPQPTGTSLMLSLVLTNYNHARYLPTALEGLASQTRPVDQAIFIDDASADESVSIFEQFLPRFKNATLIRNAKNAGVVANMNRGLELSKCDFVYFAAADDLVYSKLFERATGLLTAYPRAGLFSALSDIMDEGGKILGTFPTPIPIDKPGYLNPAETAQHLLEDDGWFMGNTTIYRRQALADAGGFPIELNAFTDGYMSRLMALKFGACFSPEVLCAWRRLEGGVSSAQSLDLAKTMRIIELVEKRITQEGDTFPEGYARRWRGRHLFASQRYGLTQETRRAREAGGAAYYAALAREWLLTAWLFVTLRPRDLLTVARRRTRQLRGDGEV
jgi:glycosyltransferase involved in cell wall biosynthesis